MRAPRPVPAYPSSFQPSEACGGGAGVKAKQVMTHTTSGRQCR